jgi:hypothetical protein
MVKNKKGHSKSLFFMDYDKFEKIKHGTLYVTMTWVDEWRSMLEHKSRASLQSYPMNYHTEIYADLRLYCRDNGLVYFPALYDEYVTWAANNDTIFSYEDICEFATHSKLIQEQLNEFDSIRNLERIAQAEHIRFYDGDSIMEKVSLAAYYMGLRSGG